MGRDLVLPTSVALETTLLRLWVRPFRLRLPYSGPKLCSLSRPVPQGTVCEAAFLGLCGQMDPSCFRHKARGESFAQCQDPNSRLAVTELGGSHEGGQEWVGAGDNDTSR